MPELSNENPNIKKTHWVLIQNKSKRKVYSWEYALTFFCQRAKMKTAENHVMFGRCVPTQKDLSLSSLIKTFMFGLTD